MPHGVRLFGFQTARPSLRLILRRMRQGTFVLEHLAEIAAINPAVAGRAFDEVLGVVIRRLAEAPTNISTARKADH